MITTIDFRSALYELVEYESNPISRMRCRRALRNDRLFNRWYQHVNDMAIASRGLGADEQPIAFDFDTLVEWLTENWDEILKILFTLLPLFL